MKVDEISSDAATRTSLADPLLTAILANRLEGIVREMENTLLRAARSAVIAAARDFSCVIITGDDQLLATAEGLPVHIFGAHLQSASMRRLHSDLEEGDAFLHNDPYLGNTHAADHTILVPVFYEGEHLFTASAKAHQADTGNSVPTTYVAEARDVYAEGALIFPCVRVQRGYRMCDDIVRMCNARIRVPEQWHGDFLAALGAARTAERRLKELCHEYGKALIKTFMRSWLDYSEARMARAIRQMPSAHLVGYGKHDPIVGLIPDGLPIKMVIDVKPAEAIIEVDLRDNIDCLDCGLNQSETCALNNTIAGIFNCVDPDVPHNSGAFRRLRIHLRDGCVVGRPVFPHSCSMATTNLAARLVNLVQSTFADLGDGHGLAEGGCGMGAGMAVISGRDSRQGGRPFINQLFASLNGGPGSPKADGWVSFTAPQSPGNAYRDSIELDEIKQPIHFKSVRLLSGTGGAGRFRGAPSSEIIYGPKQYPVTVIIPSDGMEVPPKGVRGGQDGCLAATFLRGINGLEQKLPNVVRIELQPNEWVRGIENSGGGYGDPLERDPERVRHDVLENWETIERARDVYGVLLTGAISDESLTVDLEGTQRRRAELSRKATADVPSAVSDLTEAGSAVAAPS
jgi:N-methylhydantoinase B